jgi:hypothetical protein
MINVKHLAGEEWQVTVEAGVTTQHHVRIAQADLDRFGGGWAQRLDVPPLLSHPSARAVVRGAADVVFQLRADVSYFHFRA